MLWIANFAAYSSGFAGSKEDKGQEAAEAVLATVRVLRRVHRGA